MSKAGSPYNQAVALHEAYNAKTPAQKLVDIVQHKAAMHVLWDEFTTVKGPSMALSQTFSKLIDEVNAS